MPVNKILAWILPAAFAAVQLSAQPAKVPATPEELISRNLGPRDQINHPFPPHKIVGNVYFVGTAALGSFLITTQAGNILINTDFERTVPVIRSSVEKLGFRFADIKIVLGSHAHADHMEGDALVKEMTGAQVMAMEQDVPALEKMRPGNKPHPIDRVLHDGDQVTLGGTTLVAHFTPGHSKGCTTWTLQVPDNGRSYDVVIIGSVGVNPDFKLVDNPDYHGIAWEKGRIHSSTPKATATSWTLTRMSTNAGWTNSGRPRESSACLQRHGVLLDVLVNRRFLRPDVVKLFSPFHAVFLAES
jgi:glyoxylase-like metal-dependent hydrolase (beta-lactamase superfamily II)